MAFALSEEQFRCSICLDIFKNPVSIPCGHNFCFGCIKHFWDTRQKSECPLCKEAFKIRPELRINVDLRDITEKFKRSLKDKPMYKPAPAKRRIPRQPSKSDDVLCDICEGHKPTAVKSCLVCRQSYCEVHLTPHLRDQMMTKHMLTDPGTFVTSHLCRNHNKLLEMFCTTDKTPICMKCTERDHRHHEIVPMEKESKRIRSQMKKTKSEFQQMVQDRIRKFEGIKASVESSKVKAIKINQYAVDVTLDPSTAAGWLILSPDGKQVSLGYQQRKVPDDPRRFDSCVSVLGKQSFTSGRHYWVVQVGDKTDWDLGVAKESINKKGLLTVRPDSGYWAICRRKGGNLTACAGPSITLHLHELPQKVGVFLDYGEGLVSFYNAEAKTHIYTYSGCTFTEPLYPYLNPCLHDNGKNTAPLIICPVEVVFADETAAL